MPRPWRRRRALFLLVAFLVALALVTSVGIAQEAIEGEEGGVEAEGDEEGEDATEGDPPASAGGDEDAEEDPIEGEGEGSAETEEDDSGPAPTPAPTKTGLTKEWTPVNGDADLDPSFFSSESNNEPVEGSMYFSFCSVRDGLTNATYLSLRATNVIEMPALRSMERFVLQYPGDGKVIIGLADGAKYWKGNKEKRTIEVTTDQNEATPFELLTNAKKDAVLLRLDDLYLRASHGKQGNSVALSPYLVSRSFFRAWTNAAELKAEDMAAERLERAEKILQQRRKAEIANPMYIAYDLALALLTKKPFDAFPLEDVNGNDLAVIVDEAITLITSSPLFEEYQALYPLFNRDLPEHLDIYSWSAVVKATGQMPWQEMINALQQTIHSIELPLHNNLRALVLANFQAADADGGTGLTVFNGPLIFETYFTASCNIVWLSKGEMTLAQMIDAVEFPLLEKPELAGSHLTQLPNKYEEYWFTKLIKTNVSSLTYSATEIFPELALLKHLKPEWVSEHSWIGEGIAKQFTKRVDEALKTTKIADIVSMFSSKQREAREILQTALAYCKPASRFSFCVIPQLFQMAKNLMAYTAIQSLPQYPLDMRSISNIDLQTYISERKSEMKLTEQINSILKMKSEAILLSDQMFNDVAEKMKTAGLEAMVKAKDQLLADASASYEQVRNSSQFKIDIAKTQVDAQIQLASTAYDSAMTVEKKYLDNIEEISKKATDAAMQAAFFEVIRTGVAVGQGASMLTKPGGLVTKVQSVVGVKAQFNAMKAQMKKIGTADGLMQQIQDALPEIENISTTIAEKMPAIEKIRATAMPIVSAEDKTAFANETDAIGRAVMDMRDWSLSVRIGRLKFLFGTLANQMCTIINRAAFPPCVTVLGYTNEYFGNIQASLDATNEVLNALGDLAGGAADTQAADVSYKAIAEQADGTSATLKDLKEQYETNQDEKKLALFKMRKQQDTDAAFSTSLALQSQATFLQLLYLLCARLTLSDGGHMPDLCEKKVMQFQPLEPNDVNVLISSTASKGADPRRTSALLPTQPAFPGDTGYLDLNRLMNGQPIAIRLPMNDTWLQQHGWIKGTDSIENTLFFLNRFRITLPPRYVDFEEEVVIEVQSQGLSDLGPPMAASRMRYVQLSPTKFVTNYISESTCHGDLVESPYANCGAPMKQLCIQQAGLSESKEKGMMVPLFTAFVITATFQTSTTQPQGFAYRDVATPLLIRVNANVSSSKLKLKKGSGGKGGADSRKSTRSSSKKDATKDDADTAEGEDDEIDGDESKSEDTNESGDEGESGEANVEDDEEAETRRFLRQVVVEATEAKIARCCKVGSYIRVWNEKKNGPSCSACPAGSVSQLGGLFCTYPRGDGGEVGEEEGGDGVDADVEDAGDADADEDAGQERRWLRWR